MNNCQPFEGFVVLEPDPAVEALLAECENQIICETDPITGTGCIDKANICDGIPDCSDGTDEENCDFTCGDGQYQCQGSVQRCISTAQFCDGTSDCPNNDDESECRSICPGNMLTCSNGNCVQANKMCDGIRDCPDNGDKNLCGKCIH
ncbi:lipoprotein receptor-related protein [Mactra antiquata]